MEKDQPKEKVPDSLQPSVQPKPSALSMADWLAYVLGGFLIIGNVYKLPAIINTLNQLLSASSRCTGALYRAYPLGCKATDLTFSELASVFLTLVLILLGALTILFKKKFLAQTVSVFLLAQLVLLYSLMSQASETYRASTAFWLYLLQPAFQVPLVQLILAAVCSRMLNEPSLFTRMATPAYVMSFTSNLKRWRKVLIIALGVAGAVIGAGVAVIINLNHINQDKKTVAAIDRIAKNIYESIGDTSVSTPQEVYSWVSTNEKMAKASGLRFVPGAKQFQLCADFLTNQAHGSTKRLGLAAADIQNHPDGDVCYNYPVKDEQVIRKDAKVTANMIVVDIRYLPASQHETIQTYPLDPGGVGSLDSVDLSIAQLAHKDGTKALAEEVKLGNTVSLHYQLNLLTARMDVYKIVITDGGVNANYCNLIVLGSTDQVSPNPVWHRSII